MFLKSLALFAVALLVTATIQPAHAGQECAFVMKKLMSANSVCRQGNGASCKAVDALKPMAIDACGAQTVANAGFSTGGSSNGGNGLKPHADQINRQKLFQLAQNWEGRFCKYFTRPYKERSYSQGVQTIRLNSYVVGDNVCHQKMLFQCGRGQVWRYQGPCNDYQPTYKHSSGER